MDVRFIHRENIPLLGMSFFGDPFREAGDWSIDNEIGRLSKRYLEFRHVHSDQVDLIIASSDFYEVHIYTEETESKGFFEVFVGQEMKKMQPVPLDLSIKILPGGNFAVFKLVGEQIVSDWYKDIDNDLMRKGWRRGKRFFFQVYDQRYKGMEHIDESELSAFIPVIAIDA